MKECNKCRIKKDISLFNKDSKSKDSKRAQCKSCESLYRKNNRERINKASREYRSTDKGKEVNKKCRIKFASSEKGKESQRERQRKYSTSEKGRKKRRDLTLLHKNAFRSRAKFNYSIKIGRTKKQTICSDCGKECKANAHHDDYNKPFDVRWLCIQCHNKWHNTEGNNAINSDEGIFTNKKRNVK